jgi:hypothetical protein
MIHGFEYLAGLQYIIVKIESRCYSRR